MTSAGLITGLSVLIIGLPIYVQGITTVHHDKPEESQISMKSSDLAALNVTLTPSERQKRLMPYENYYTAQRFNLPHDQQPYTTGKQRYQATGPPKKGAYIVQYRKAPNDQNQEALYQQKFTPFLESNAIPGPFVPMVQPPEQTPPPPQKIKVQFVQIPQQTEGQQPDYSAIYDKLSQLKFVQQRPRYYQTYRIQQRPTYQPPVKTMVETYTPTNIDIPSQNEEYQPQPQQQPQQEQYQTIKNYDHEGRKPYGQQVIVVPQRGVTRRPIIILQQKPVVNEQPKIYHYRGENIETVPITKPIVYVPRKQTYRPKVVLVSDNNNQAKYASPVKYTENPRYETMQPQQYVQEQTYQPSNEYAPTDTYPASVQTYEPYPPPQKYYATEPPQATTESNNLALILKQLQETNTLPETLTPENIDNSIKTLVKILGTLRKQQKLTKPIVVEDEYDDSEADDGIVTSYPGHHEDGGTPGKPGVDYPALSSIPQTTFNCKTQRYKGFFGDPDTNCQVWHYCDLNGGQASFLCPNGTIFSQVALTCDWWYNVKCATTAQLYVLNERLYKYIIPLTPKFPEDYSGPLVDKYLALKFQEMEDKMKKERGGKQQQEKDKEKESEELQNIEEEAETEEGVKEEPKDANLSQNTLQSVESGEK